MESHERGTDDPDVAPPQHDAWAKFQEAFTSILTESAELKHAARHSEHIDARAVLGWRDALEGLMHQLYVEMGDPSQDDVQREMKARCHELVAEAAQCAFDFAVTKPEVVRDDDEGQHGSPSEEAALETECQGAVARMAELNIILQMDRNQKNSEGQTKEEVIEEVIDTYVGYQKKVLRERVKPAISRLVAVRKHEAELAASGREQHIGTGDDENDAVDDEDDEEEQRSSHIHIMTVILGQASALIHPLIAWRANLEQPYLCDMCTRSIDMLDDQAQKLTKTVTGWFVDDRNVESWMTKSTDANAADPTTSDGDTIDLGELDALVEEMAFACQVLARYVALVKDHTTVPSEKGAKPISQEIQPVWTWNYATLERYLGTQQWKSALRCANPVHIVIGTAVQVPSVVEDAQYLSTRALERAASTRSTQAIGIVAQSITNDVWSTDIDIGVHRALVTQTGCWQDPDSTTKSGGEVGNSSTSEPSAKKAPSSFASAFLGALDSEKSRSPSKPPSAPSSGTFLGSLSTFGGGNGANELEQIRIETSICALNGVYSASASCSSLVEFLDSLLPNEEIQQDARSAPMIQLAREELFRFADVYKRMLKAMAGDLFYEWCGRPSDVVQSIKSTTPCLPALRRFLFNESFELRDAAELQVAEDDARLDHHLLEPLQKSKLLSQLKRCDVHVLTIICELLSESLVDLIFDGLMDASSRDLTLPPPMRVNDWGALLLSKQVRVLQNFVSRTLEAGLDGGAMPDFTHWERLSQAITALQLETPSDWMLYQPTSILSPDELRRILSLRVDFSKEAIASIVANAAATASKS